MPTFQPYWRKPAVRNDRGDRGDVGITRSPVRASILPDCGGRGEISVPTATDLRRCSKSAGMWGTPTVTAAPSARRHPTDAVEKVFAGESNSSVLPVHAARADVSDHVESQEGAHRASYASDGGLRNRRHANTVFREMSCAAQFLTFRQHRPFADLCPWSKLNTLECERHDAAVRLNLRPEHCD